MDLPDFSNYDEVDEGDTITVAELSDQDFVSEVNSINELDDPKIEFESKPETEVADVSTVQVQQAIDCLKQYIVKNDIPEDLNDEFMTAAGKMNKYLMFTKIHKSIQTKITPYFK